ncbi:GNAT family N-acetyltransferase [Polluticaenibacter yanchengensis]|uniref:GNAT family N-acetyltransferase n=1 Tax=Polluticaenibacter yanchengensis TaxID=3014562 RepID=A0ABT4UHB8_9BACT|nr:GNAT family N-acetyltransferase [Chitinophagaceae bacterium LY-5]
MAYNIKPYLETYHSEVLATWEKSVKATHHFLTETDFNAIKSILQSFNFSDIHVHCLFDGDKMAGFTGIADAKIEMLFLDPAYIGKGLGRQLVNFAFDHYQVNAVDVNEQNTAALAFYQKAGFKVYERTEKDDQGKSYPILRMKI